MMIEIHKRKLNQKIQFNQSILRRQLFAITLLLTVWLHSCFRKNKQFRLMMTPADLKFYSCASDNTKIRRSSASLSFPHQHTQKKCWKLSYFCLKYCRLHTLMTSAAPQNSCKQPHNGVQGRPSLSKSRNSVYITWTLGFVQVRSSR